MPWEREDDGGKMYKYQYHPNGDKDKAPKDAPSALNSVVVPNVTLPVVLFPDLIVSSHVGLAPRIGDC